MIEGLTSWLQKKIFFCSLERLKNLNYYQKYITTNLQIRLYLKI